MILSEYEVMKSEKAQDLRKQGENLLAICGRRVPAFQGWPFSDALRWGLGRKNRRLAHDMGVSVWDITDKLVLRRPVKVGSSTRIVSLLSEYAIPEKSPSLRVDAGINETLELTKKGAIIWSPQRQTTRSEFSIYHYPQVPSIENYTIAQKDFTTADLHEWQIILDQLAREAFKLP